MGIFVYKTKIGFGAVLEHWTPIRSTKKLDTKNYPTYGLTETMTYEQADQRAKEGCTPKTGAVELLLATIGFHSDSKIIKISHSVSSI